MKITEKIIQSRLYEHLAFTCQHKFITPNPGSLYQWQPDLVSITKSDFVYEFEIKLSKADFKQDFKKKYKHEVVLKRKQVKSPNYFRYIIYGFDLDKSEVPDYAGLMFLKGKTFYDEIRLDLQIIKSAPRLHSSKITDKCKQKLYASIYNRYWGWRMNEMLGRK